MIRAVNKRCLEVNNRISRQNAVLNTFSQTLFNSREIVFRDSAAEDVFGKFKIFLFAGLKLNPDMTVLTVTAGLFLVFSFNLDFFAYSLSVRNFGFEKINRNAEFCFKFAYDNVKVLLAHTGNQHLTCFFIICYFKARIFFFKLAQTRAYLLLIAFCLWRNCHGQNGNGEFYGVEKDGL